MTERHEQIVARLLEQYRQQPEIVVINLFGSMAKGGVHPDSDIDMELISKTAEEWLLVKKEIDGITVDLCICPLEHFHHQVSNYPYLCYDYLTEKVLYDPHGIFAKAHAELANYFTSNPEVVMYWETKLTEMREKKRAGTHKMADIVAAYDIAELRFSIDGKISRNFLRG